jgi:hypothetical protein
MSDPTAITLAHRASRSDQVLFQNLDGEAVLLDLASETYFGLNEVGTRIWQLIETAPSLSEVHSALCTEFDADATRIKHDLLALVGELSKAGLVTVH